VFRLVGFSPFVSDVRPTTRRETHARRPAPGPVEGEHSLEGSQFRTGALGVRRIGVGAALSRAALRAFIRAAREMREQGTFTFAADALPYAEANDLVTGP
jgi:hypothetical protein